MIHIKLIVFSLLLLTSCKHFAKHIPYNNLYVVEDTIHTTEKGWGQINDSTFTKLEIDSTTQTLKLITYTL